MSALPNTRDAIGESLSSTGRHARRISRRTRHAATDIADELRDLVAELETTLGKGTQADAEILRADVLKRLDAARERLDVAQAAARERASDALTTTNEYVQSNPWQAVAIASGVALIAGALIARCR